MTDSSTLLALLAAALGGAAIGVERQRTGHASGANARFAGIRTFTLLGIVAGVALAGVVLAITGASGAVVSTVQFTAGVNGEVLSAASVAFTLRSWGPSARGVVVMAKLPSGPAMPVPTGWPSAFQASTAQPSSRHCMRPGCKGSSRWPPTKAPRYRRAYARRRRVGVTRRV